MILSKRTLILGVCIMVIPFLGLPTSWKTASVLLSGILLIFFSIKIVLPKKLPKRPRKKEKVTDVFVESIPVQPRPTLEVLPDIDMDSNRQTEAK